MNSKMLIHSAVYTLSHYAEGHVGMDIEESETAKKGLNKAMSNEDLKRVAEYLRAKGATATMVNLKKSPDEPDARVLFIKNGINWIGADREKVFNEMRSLGKDGMDTRYYNSRRKMVQNKLARWNFNAGDRHQDADIPNGKNTLYHFDELPELGKIRQGINKMADQLKMPHLNGLLAEANVYYNDTCGIRYHGDDERPESPVIGCNLGEDRFICFRSFFKHRFYGNEFKVKLSHGDMYFMSEEAVGIGWIRKTHQKVIFRHRAGSARFLLKHDKELARRDARKDAKKRKKQLTLESFVKRKKTCVKHTIIPVRGEMGDHTTYECRYCDYTSGCV